VKKGSKRDFIVEVLARIWGKCTTVRRNEFLTSTPHALDAAGTSPTFVATDLIPVFFPSTQLQGMSMWRRIFELRAEKQQRTLIFSKLNIFGRKPTAKTFLHEDELS